MARDGAGVGWGLAGRRIVLYEYQQTRAREHPQAFLNGFAGYLHVDAYAGYDGLPGITISGCWAHARRYFTDTLKAQPLRAKDAPPTATQGVWRFVTNYSRSSANCTTSRLKNATRVAR